MDSPARPVLFMLALLLALPGPAHAQDGDLTPRFGLGTQGLVSTEDGFGLGLRTRASAPLNADVSAAVDLGLTGFVFGGRDDAIYLFEPQVSLVVNLPSQGSRLPYLLAGVSGHFPLTRADRSESGPVIHLGIGRVQALTDSSLFYEVNPGLLIGEESVDLLLPIRIGLIFR
ncbi:MAG: hypothetical protein BRD52_07795 [Bacteroidetes bacterium SW_4_67_19]|nr:MAG: hypothetical protein BRD52_07795 [Bacteroidetes bacterium SW_4_67_19]